MNTSVTLPLVFCGVLVEAVQMRGSALVDFELTKTYCNPTCSMERRSEIHRVGFGTDLHRLEAGRPLVLGHVRVESDRGPVAHSDGDVVLHAIIDALAGATGLPDIGE